MDAQARQLAMAVEALTREREAKAEAMKDFGARIETLQGEVNRLSRDILTGQGSLLEKAEN